MPKGESPNSWANIAKANNSMTAEERRKNAQKAGKRSGVVRKEYKTFKECFQSEMTAQDREDLYRVLMSRAKAGNLKAFELLRDTLGEKPVDSVEVSQITFKFDNAPVPDEDLMG